MNKSRIFFSPSWLVAGFAGSTLFGILVSDRLFLPAFADGLMIAGVLFISIAWLLHLKGDGLRVLPSRSSKDRIPAPGNAPVSPSPLPGEDGPNSEAYMRLEKAERSLRERIAGADSGEDSVSRIKTKKTAREIAISGGILFLISLIFQYLAI